MRRQRRAKAGKVRAAFGGGDVVDVGVDVLGVFRRVLQGHFQADAVVFAGDVDHFGVRRLGGAVQMRDELDDAALVLERVAFAGALIAEGDLHAAIQKRQLLQAACTACCRRTFVAEDLRVGLERGFGADFVRGADAADFGGARRARILADRRALRGGLRLRTIRRGS